MLLDFHKSHSKVYPELLDTTSSATVSYVRKNVQEVEETAREGEEPGTIYEYDEAILTKEEYARYLQDQKTEQLRADVDYIMLMGDM